MWTEEEDEILINAQIQMGNKWSYISKLLPGRSENAVKNRYNSIASRNGVRKKRLGNFVNRSVAARNNLLRFWQSLPKAARRGRTVRTRSCWRRPRRRSRGGSGRGARRGSWRHWGAGGAVRGGLAGVNEWSINGWSINGWSVNEWVNGWSINGWSINEWSVYRWSVYRVVSL